MNSCVLMGKIVRSPQLRYTQDNQLAIAEMMVEFENLSPNTPPCTLKVVAWGSLGVDIEKNYTEGNTVVLTGRLKMDLVERQNYKEKVAELTLSHIYPLSSQNPPQPPNNVVNLNSYQSHDDIDESDMDDEVIEGKNLDNIPF